MDVDPQAAENAAGGLGDAAGAGTRGGRRYQQLRWAGGHLPARGRAGLHPGGQHHGQTGYDGVEKLGRAQAAVRHHRSQRWPAAGAAAQRGAAARRGAACGGGRGRGARRSSRRRGDVIGDGRAQLAQQAQHLLLLFQRVVEAGDEEGAALQGAPPPATAAGAALPPRSARRRRERRLAGAGLPARAAMAMSHRPQLPAGHVLRWLLAALPLAAVPLAGGARRALARGARWATHGGSRLPRADAPASGCLHRGSPLCAAPAAAGPVVAALGATQLVSFQVSGERLLLAVWRSGRCRHRACHRHARLATLARLQLLLLLLQLLLSPSSHRRGRPLGCLASAALAADDRCRRSGGDCLLATRGACQGQALRGAAAGPRRPCISSVVSIRPVFRQPAGGVRRGLDHGVRQQRHKQARLLLLLSPILLLLSPAPRRPGWACGRAAVQPCARQRGAWLLAAVWRADGTGGARRSLLLLLLLLLLGGSSGSPSVDASQAPPLLYWRRSGWRGSSSSSSRGRFSRFSCLLAVVWESAGARPEWQGKCM